MIQSAREEVRQEEERGEREWERVLERRKEKKKEGGGWCIAEIRSAPFSEPHFNKIKRLSLSDVEKEKMKGYKSVSIEKRLIFASALDWVMVPSARILGHRQPKRRQNARFGWEESVPFSGGCCWVGSKINQVYWKYLAHKLCMHVDVFKFKNAGVQRVSPCEFGADLLPRLQSLLIGLHGQDVFLLQLSFGGTVTQLDGQRVFPQHLLGQGT